ncbi:MAG TPA: DUF6326 family protein [Cytophagales bacterium]|nr:DUF6326 family protein [Cytophagales bacterium]
MTHSLKPQVILSTLWVFVLMNMIYADLLNTLKPSYLSEIAHVAKHISGETVLFFALLMEIPIAMVLLSRILNRKANRMANMIAVPICILWVIIPSVVMESGHTPLSYIFFASIECLSMLCIFAYAWHWSMDDEA